MATEEGSFGSLIIAGVAASIVLILVIVLVCLCRRKKRPPIQNGIIVTTDRVKIIDKVPAVKLDDWAGDADVEEVR